MRRTGGESPEPGDEIPDNGTNESSHNEADGEGDDRCIKRRDVDNIFSNGLRYGRAKQKGTGEFTNRCHQKGFPGGEGSCADDGGYHVGCVMEAIRVIEEKG
jgi:hypothetical protein